MVLLPSSGSINQIGVAHNSNTTTTNENVPDHFSDRDVHLIVQLILSGHWSTVQYYFQFLILHYERFLHPPQTGNSTCNNDNSNNNYNDLSSSSALTNPPNRTYLPSMTTLYNRARTANILSHLNELLTNIRIQEFFELLERCHNASMTEQSTGAQQTQAIVSSHLLTLKSQLSATLYDQMLLFASNRESFLRYKRGNLCLDDHESCCHYRARVANHIKQGLSQLVVMYQNRSGGSGSGSSSSSSVGCSDVHHQRQNRNSRATTLSSNTADTTSTSASRRLSLSSVMDEPSVGSGRGHDDDNAMSDIVSNDRTGEDRNREESSHGESGSPSINNRSPSKMDTLLQAFNLIDTHARSRDDGPQASSTNRDCSPSVPLVQSQIPTKESSSLLPSSRSSRSTPIMNGETSVVQNWRKSKSNTTTLNTSPVVYNADSQTSSSMPNSYKFRSFPYSPSPALLSSSSSSVPSPSSSLSNGRVNGSSSSSSSSSGSSSIHSHTNGRTHPRRAMVQMQHARDLDIERKVSESLKSIHVSIHQKPNTIKPTVKLCTGGITSTPALRERMYRVLEQLGDMPATWDVIQNRVSGNRAKVWATLCMLVNEGVVIQSGKGRRGHPYKYMLASDSTENKLALLENKFRTLDFETQQIYKQYKKEVQKKQQLQQLQQQQQQQQSNGESSRHGHHTTAPVTMMMSSKGERSRPPPAPDQPLLLPPRSLSSPLITQVATGEATRNMPSTSARSSAIMSPPAPTNHSSVSFVVPSMLVSSAPSASLSLSPSAMIHRYHPTPMTTTSATTSTAPVHLMPHIVQLQEGLEPHAILN